MRVILTGHLGYIGSAMAPMLLEAGHEVVGLDTGLFAACVLGPTPQDPDGLTTDIRDVRTDQLAGFDAVIHLAALSNDPLGMLDPALTHEINYDATVRLARLAREAGVKRFLYASTCSVYGTAGDELVPESAPLRPLTPYAESKVRVEEDLFALADSDFCPVSLRNATAFGFSPRLRADIVLNNLVGHAVLSGEVRVLSDGTPWRPLVHVSDIGRAFLTVLDAPTESVRAVAFNVGAPDNNLSVAQIAAHVADAVPGSRVVITGEAGPDLRSYRVDVSKLPATVPAYRAEWSVPAGAAELAAAYQSFGLDQAQFEGRFVRLAHLQKRLAAGSLAADLRPRAPETVDQV